MKKPNGQQPQIARRNRCLHHLSIVFSLVCITVMVGCDGNGEREEPYPDRIKISVNDDLSSVTIIANDVSRSRILEDLRTQHQIEIRPYDLADEVISVRIEEVPLEAAVARLLPQGTRYVLRVGEREVTVVAQPNKAKKGEPESKPEGLPTKDKTRPLPDDQRVKIKIDPESWREPKPRVGENLKPKAVSITEIPHGKGAKIPRKTVTTERTGRLNFVMIASGQIRLVSATLVEGATRTSNVVRGPYLFVLRSASGDILHFGSFHDPLELHSYRDDGTHTLGRAAEGNFGIWVPGELVSEERLPSLTLELYDARQVTLPASLNEKSIIQAIHGATRIAQLKGKALFKSFMEGIR